MFHKDGRWKEFGTVSADHTIFPFWMFCFVWAIISYLITLLIIGRPDVAAATALATRAAKTLEKIETPDDLLTPLPSKTKGRKIKESIESNYGEMKPGYYLLNTKATKSTGVPKYIYIGKEPSQSFSTVGGAKDSTTTASYDEDEEDDEDEDEEEA